jgi:hypothetical protein
MAKVRWPVGASQSSQAKQSKNKAISAPSAKLRDRCSRALAWLRKGSAVASGVGRVAELESVSGKVTAGWPGRAEVAAGGGVGDDMLAS